MFILIMIFDTGKILHPNDDMGPLLSREMF